MTTPTWNNPIIKWIEYRLPVFAVMQRHLIDYPTPKNLSYWWNFGSLAGIVLTIMVVTGVFLSMSYTPHVDYAFESVEHIVRDVNYGWLLRYLHANGGSMFFLAVYIHLFRGLYYGSYKAPREILWIIGVIIILCMMATAFTGYVLPWGQMSYWAATVITSMFSAVPLVGEPIVTWLWGGFTVGNPTLNRFYSLHYLLPFIIFALVFVHLWALHEHHSNNPLGVEAKEPEDVIPFHPYYTIKDLYGLGVFMIFYLGFVFFAPDFFGEPDNYIKANSLVTPAHIVPEWYLLPYYAILRAITFDIWFLSAKLIGVVAMFASILILLFLPWLDRSKVLSARFRPVYKYFFWILVLDCVVLAYVGANPPEGWFILLGQVATAYYFLHFIVILPLLGKLEKPGVVPDSISAAVIKAPSGSTDTSTEAADA
jgi:quinol-cytochrome oxidoreductase complex cytochrome b subunit